MTWERKREQGAEEVFLLIWLERWILDAFFMLFGLVLGILKEFGEMFFFLCVFVFVFGSGGGVKPAFALGGCFVAFVLLLLAVRPIEEVEEEHHAGNQTKLRNS